MNNSATTIELGAAFESRVAAYYEALGFKTDRNVQLGEHQIDLLVSRHVPGASILSYMIEAKYRESGAVGVNDVTAFVNVARDLISMGEISGATMITNTGFSKNAMGKGVNSKTIKLLTISQLETEIFATSESLLRACADYERQKISSEYIPLSGVKRPAPFVTVPDVTAHLREWADSEGGLITLVGDFGSGKTTVMDRLFYDLARARVDKGSGRFPIQLKLRSLLSHGSLWAFVSASLRDSQYITPAQSVFDALLEAGGFVFLLDGFDEIHTGATSAERARYLKRLLPLLSSPCPCVLSTRPTYFASFHEMNSVLQHLLEPPAAFERLANSPLDPNWLLGRLNIAKPERLPAETLANAIHLNPLNDGDVLRYLANFREQILQATGADETSMLSFLSRIYDIRDLLRRPLLLNMVIVTIVEGGLDIARPKSTIGPSTLYDLYTQTCVRRDASKRPGSRRLAQILTPEERLAGCRELAMEMLRKGAIELRMSEVHDAVARIKVSQKKTMAKMEGRELRERILTDIRLCSFLSFSDEEVVRFAHKSFFEFFVAQQFLIEVGERLSAISSFARVKITKEIVGFLGSYARDVPAFAQQVTDAFHNRGGDESEVDTMFYRVALASGVLLSSAPLRNRKILDVELRRASITGASLEGVSLCRVELDSLTASDWRLRRVSLEDSAIESCSFDASELDLRCDRATLRDVRLEASSLVLRGQGLDLEDVRLAGGSLVLDVGADLRGLHLDGLRSLTLGPALQLGRNTDLTVSNTSVAQASASTWYQSASRIRFADCVLLGLFLPAADIDAVLSRNAGSVTVENCEGLVLTRGAGARLASGSLRVRNGGRELMVVDAEALERALELSATVLRPLPKDASQRDREAHEEATSARAKALALLDAITSWKPIATRADELTGPLAFAFGREASEPPGKTEKSRGGRKPGGDLTRTHSRDTP